jgi:peroxiredoxin Q/BCP
MSYERQKLPNPKFAGKTLRATREGYIEDMKKVSSHVPKIGHLFPEVSGQTFDGHHIDLSDLRGKKNVVVFFYCADQTPGCTRETIEFSQRLPEFHTHNTEVIGISVDSLASHGNFARKYELHVPLLSDKEKKLTKGLGILNDKEASAKRTTFVLDREGFVRRVFENVNVAGHVDEVLAAIKDINRG